MSNNGNRAGLQPVETVEKFEIATSQVADFLQKRLNTFTSTARKNGIDIPDVQISLVSIDWTKKFVPMMIVLPEEAIKSRGANGQGIYDIFKDESNDNVSKIEKPIWDALLSFIYTKDDKKAFLNSGLLKKNLSLTSRMASEIAGLCSPKIMKSNDSSRKSVVFLIDPIKVISDMIKTGNDDVTKQGVPRYFTVIEKVERISHENYKYFVTKEPKKQKKDNVSDILRIVKQTHVNK